MKSFRINHKELAQFFAPIMFGLSLLFLVLVATLIVLWVDVPRFEMVSQNFGDAPSDISDPEHLAEAATGVGDVIIYALFAIWIVIVAEVLVQLYLSARSRSVEKLNKWRVFALFQCICPPLRLAAPNIAHEGQIWLPWIGWQTPNRKLYRRLERAFSKPMLFFALLILPLLLIEFGLHSVLEQQFWLRFLIHICTGLIWCAFAIEFIVLVSASEKRLAYIKKNWIDLAIILLPIVLFLRSLRAIRLARLAKLAKVQQLVQMSRVYRVRAVAMKLVRALMLLEVFGRLFGMTPQKRLDRLRSEYQEKQEELDEIAQEIQKLQIELENQETADLESSTSHKKRA